MARFFIGSDYTPKLELNSKKDLKLFYKKLLIAKIPHGQSPALGDFKFFILTPLAATRRFCKKITLPDVLSLLSANR